jgi:DNA-directed RNA polymerase subunit alpha
MLDFSGITLTKVAEKEAGVSATYEVGPLPKGYGNTLGNSLRRVLLSSLEGAAISSVRINNLSHEFTTIPGVKQNMLDLVLRLKNLRVKLAAGETTSVLSLNKKGKGVITAKDFTTAKGVEIINDDFVIAEVTDDSTTLSIEAIVEKGVGYRRADESLRDEIGRIPVDTVFSPVKLVDFTVLPTRKGSQADLDKIVMGVTTDGTLTPDQALAQASVILRQFVGQVAIVLGGSDESIAEPVVADATEMTNWKIAEIGVDKKMMTKLADAGIETLSDVTAKAKTYFSKELKLTAKQVKELQDVLAQYNLDFAKDAKKSKKA